MVLTLSRRRMRLLLTMFDGLNTNSLMDIPFSPFVDVDCEPKTLGRSSISCSPSDYFESFDGFIIFASSGILTQSILDCNGSYSQKQGYLQLLWHRLRQSPMVSNQKLERKSEYRYYVFRLLYYRLIFFQFQQAQISTMKKQQKRASDRVQSAVNNLLQKESQSSQTVSSLDCSSSVEAQVYLDFTLTSYEALMALAVTQKEYFPEIDFFVQSYTHFDNGYEPEVNIIFSANESEVVGLQGKFKSIDININKSEPIERTNAQTIKIGDYFGRMLFNNGKYAVLKTQYYSEQIQKLFAKGQFLFGCTTLPLKKISHNTYIVHNTAVNDHVAGKVTKSSNFFPEFIPLVDCKCYFKINSQSESQEIGLANLQLANCLELDEIYQIKANLRIDETVTIFLQATFQKEEALSDFLMKNYERLQKVINFDIGKCRLKKVMNFSELPQFFLELSNRIKYADEHLNLLDQKRKYISENNQSNLTHISSYVFEEMKHKLEFGGDLLCLQPYWCPQLREDFVEVYNRWEIEKYELQPIFISLFSILNDMIRREFIVGSETTSSLYEMIYPGITAIVDLFASKIDYTIFKTSSITKKPNILDCILMDFIKEIDSLNKNEGIVLVFSNKYSEPLKNAIAKFQGFRNASLRWVDVFNCLTINFRRSRCDEGEVSRFVKQIEDCRYPSLDCLGCSKFFYYRYTNILSPSKQVPIQIIPLAERMSDYQTQILEAICVMLNNHGGVILFNCVREYKQVLPMGSLLNEKDKEAIENKLNYMLGFIYPKPEIGSNITVSFVPLAIHPLTKDLPKILQRYVGEEDLKPNQIHSKLMYVEGLFVTRIKVCPTDSSKVYLHFTGNDYYLYGISKIQKTFAIKKLSQAIKRKFNSYVKSKLLQYRFRTFESPLNHKCHLPDSGVIIDSKSILKPQSLQCDFSSLEDEFTHMSMLSCKPKYLPHIKERLQAKGVRCEVEIRFNNHKFKSAINTAVLYHDCKLEELVRLCRLKEFEFEDRHVVPIYVTKFVKIEVSNFTLKEVQAGSQWLKLEFPNERLRLFELKVGRKKQFFLETDSKLSTLFMYYVFQSFDIKVTLKNPMHFDKLDESVYKVLKEVAYCRNSESREEPIRISEPSSPTQSERQTLISLEESEES